VGLSTRRARDSERADGGGARVKRATMEVVKKKFGEGIESEESGFTVWGDPLCSVHWGVCGGGVLVRCLDPPQ
jgi:hypothetical protein